MSFQLAPVNDADVAEMGTWRYPPPYSTYDVPAEDAVKMLDPALRFSAVRRDGDLIAYVCLGAEARVAGVGPVAGTEDLGFGLRPDLMGQGLSREIMPWLLAALEDQIVGEQLRVLILDWNARSLATYRRAGFTDVGSHTNDYGTFLLLTRPRHRAA